MEGAWHFLHYLLLKEKVNSLTSQAFLCKIFSISITLLKQKLLFTQPL